MSTDSSALQRLASWRVRTPIEQPISKALS
jgi:hypothetical protein